MKKLDYYKNDFYANLIMKFYLQSDIFANNPLRLHEFDQRSNYWRDIIYQICLTV